jgi:NitT/TauT family transport system ATP-binding protein
MGLTRLLPRVSINEVAGLLEHLEEREQHMEDIYTLAADLKAESDRVLRIMEAAELLGFATVDKGDAKLTSLGEAFAHASILGRKEILASRVQRLPIFKWLLTMLGQAKDRALERGVVLTSLGLEFPPEECRHQLHILINWGRYAEILGYNGKLKTIYLATLPGKGSKKAIPQ